MQTPRTGNGMKKILFSGKKKLNPINYFKLVLVSFTCLTIIVLIWILNRPKVILPKPTNVLISSVKIKDVPVFVMGLGRVVPVNTITLTTQINGILTKVLFKEGQFVKKNQLLAEIDKRLLNAQLSQYEGQLQRDKALLDNALIDLKRYEFLWKKDSISQQTLATQQALVKEYQGAIAIDNGLIQSTKVNLIYCNIISPIDGRVGLRLVDPGNYVQTSSASPLAVLTTLNPTTVIFSLPEDVIPDILPQIYANKPMLVNAYNRQNTKLLATGKLIALDNQINTNTGTVNLRAHFDNATKQLFPNQFVSVKLLTHTLHQAMLVNTASIQYQGKKSFVYRVLPNSTVEIRRIKTGIQFGHFTVVLSGLSANDQVVTQGIDKLTDGAVISLGT